MSDEKEIEQHLEAALGLIAMKMDDGFDVRRLSLARTKAQEALLWLRSRDPVVELVDRAAVAESADKASPFARRECTEIKP